MKALICGMLLLSAVLPAQSSAQEQVWMTDSSWAIQFGVQSYTTIVSFDAASLSVKTHLTESQALRIGMKVFGSRTKEHHSKETSIRDSIISQTATESDLYDFDLGATVQYLWYLDTQSDVFLFGGIGPTGRYTRNDFAPGYGDSRWSIGAAATIGAEWFATRRISFHAEYQATLFYSHSKSYDQYTQGSRVEYNEDKYSRWGFSANEVVFGLSVYFEL